MGYVSFDSLNVQAQNNGSGSNVGFFALKNDGDEAIVRFMHDSTSSFEILATHPIQLNGKFRRVSCVRMPNDPIGACPLCEKGEKLDYRFFIHLLQYTNNPDGTVSVEPKVWERSLSYANKLKEYINNYGPMSDVICKIVRHGRAGDMKTEYEIIPNLNQQVYRPDIFKKVDGLFENYKILGGIVLDKNADEIREYLNTGNFPMKEQKEETNKKSNYDSVNGWNTPSTEDELPTWGNQQTWNQPQRQAPTAPDWTMNNNSPVARPVRY